MSTPTTLDSPVLYRALNFNRASVKEDDRTIELSLSSEQPCERWFGDEILSHQEGAIRLDRLKMAGPCLWSHDPEKHIGRIVAASIRDRKLIIKVRFSRSPLAQEKWQDIQDGILLESSVGYRVHRYAIDEDRGTYTAIDWEPFEASLVTCPADLSTGIGRQQNTETFTATLTRSHPMETQTTENQPQRRMTRSQEEEHHARMLSFCDPEKNPAMKKPAWHARATALAQRYAAEGKTFGEFREDVKQCLTMDDFIDADLPTGGSGNHFTGGGGSMSNRSIGSILRADGDFTRFARKGGKREFSTEIQTRSLRTLSMAGVGGAGVVDNSQLIAEFGKPRLFIADLIPSVPTSGSSVRYLRQNGWNNTAATVGELGVKPPIDLEIEEVDSPVRKIAVTLKASDEMISDYIGTEQFISSQLFHAVMEREQAQILAGDGLGNNLEGIFTAGGTLVQPQGSGTLADAVFIAISRLNAAGYSANALCMNSAEMQTIVLAKDEAERYLSLGPVSISDGGAMPGQRLIWGVASIESASVPAGSILVGDFARGAQIARRTTISLQVSNSNNDDFERNALTWRCEERIALLLTQPGAFCIVTIALTISRLWQAGQKQQGVRARPAPSCDTGHSFLWLDPTASYAMTAASD